MARGQSLLRKTRSTVGRKLLPYMPWLIKYANPPKMKGYTAQSLDALAKNELSDKEAGSASALDSVALREGRYIKPRFVNHVDYEQPPADVVFATVCNDKYAPGLEALALSLREVYPDMRNRFVVYHDESLSDFSMHRLGELYSGFDFVEKDPTEFQVALGDHYNHRRVGLLGYLTLNAIGIEDASHVVILDTDLLVLGDISPLWKGDTIKAVPDIGQRPFGVVARSTGRPVINSGVLSLPASELGPEAVKRSRDVLSRINEVTDPDLVRFADQKFWNVYLGTREVTLLPQNFNTVKTLVEDTYPAELPNVQILHVTGPKPWYAFLFNELVTDEDRARYKKGTRQFARTFALWNQHYLSRLSRARLNLFREQESPAIRALAAAAPQRPTVLIGNGPSLAETDMTAFEGFHKVAFNWFVNHDDFDAVRPDHLVIASHMFFGGWHTPRPEMPESWITALRSHSHKPRIWAPFYFKSAIEAAGDLDGYDVSYFFYEKPFKRTIHHDGVAALDLHAPLVDSHTGVLTIGVPLALELGSEQIVLVGCDSNYGSAKGSYFYDSEKHGSKTTDEVSLMRTWGEGGQALYGYGVVRDELTARGVRFLDATIDGRLDMIEKIDLDSVRGLAVDRG